MTNNTHLYPEPYQKIKEHVSRYIDASPEEMAHFIKPLREKSLKKKELLLKPGQRVQQEFFVIKGCLMAYYINDKGNKHVIQFAVENWWVGDFDAFYNDKSTALYIEALEDTQLFTLDYPDMQKMLKAAPIFERYFRLLVTNAVIALRKRILSALEKDTLERYIEFCESYPTIEERVANYNIANYLGVSSEALSRVRAKKIR